MSSSASAQWVTRWRTEMSAKPLRPGIWRRKDQGFFVKLRYELPHDPAEALQKFRVPRKYTREQPNALTDEQLAVFLGTFKAMFPEHFAMTYLGFVIGARPSTIRPLRRKGAVVDLVWESDGSGVILLRRSNSRGSEVMDETKTGLDLDIPVPPHAMRVLEEHIVALPEGRMRNSDLLFPATTGGFRARSVLDKPFRKVLKALGWSLKLTPSGMRRTFNDVARLAEVPDIVTRAISGHQTEQMQRHYSTATLREMRKAVDKVASAATGRPPPTCTPQPAE